MNYYFDVLKKYAVFTGRARRKEYWMFVLWNFIVSFVIGIIIGLASVLANAPALSSVVWLYVLAVLLPSLAVAVRRLHDTNRGGWWLLICLVPLVGAIMILVFMVQDGTPGDNKYGPNPKGVAAVATATPTATG